jgi:4-diphosphocytidyl-2-C-methyl-D-erythritol kinase
MTPFKIKAPAKLNIRLKVTGRRRDGYHELVSIMVPIDLFDHLELSDTRGRGNGGACG